MSLIHNPGAVPAGPALRKSRDHKGANSTKVRFGALAGLLAVELEHVTAGRCHVGPGVRHLCVGWQLKFGPEQRPAEETGGPAPVGGAERPGFEHGSRHRRRGTCTAPGASEEGRAPISVHGDIARKLITGCWGAGYRNNRCTLRFVASFVCFLDLKLEDIHTACTAPRGVSSNLRSRKRAKMSSHYHQIATIEHATDTVEMAGAVRARHTR